MAKAAFLAYDNTLTSKSFLTRITCARQNATLTQFLLWEGYYESRSFRLTHWGINWVLYRDWFVLPATGGAEMNVPSRMDRVNGWCTFPPETFLIWDTSLRWRKEYQLRRREKSEVFGCHCPHGSEQCVRETDRDAAGAARLNSCKVTTPFIWADPYYVIGSSYT